MYTVTNENSMSHGKTKSVLCCVATLILGMGCSLASLPVFADEPIHNGIVIEKGDIVEKVIF